MAKNIKEAVAGKIEIVDQAEEKTGRKGRMLWLVIPAVLTIGTAAFFVTRRISHRREA